MVAARMGARVRMVGRVGDDAFGRQLLDSLAGEGIDVSGVGTDAHATTGTAVINIDSVGQNRIVQVLGANLASGEEEVARAVEALEDSSVLMLQLEVPAEVPLRVAKEAASRGVAVILDPAPAGPFPEELVALCGYVTPNETEAEALVGFPVRDASSAKRAAEEILLRGAECCIVKMGVLETRTETPILPKPSFS